MCSEKEPPACHRTLLIAQAPIQRGVEVQHILADGSPEIHQAAMERLMDLFKLPHNGDLFRSREEVIADALVRQTKRVAYVGQKPASQPDDWDHMF